MLPLITAALTLGAATTGIPTLTAQYSVAQAPTAIRFWKSLPHTTDTKDINQLASPVSYTLCLGLLLNGLKGEGQLEVTRSLGVQGINPATFDNAAQKLIASFAQDDSVKCGNIVFTTPQYEPKATYVQTLSKYFGATAERLKDTGEAGLAQVNGWVNKNTKGRIPTILDGLSTDAGIVLVNAITFDGIWEHKFSVHMTSPREFASSKGTHDVPTMQLTEHLKYAATPKARAVELDYVGGRYAMILILPESGEPDDVFSELTKLESKFQPVDLDLELPLFKFEQTIDLTKPMMAMGIQKVFRSADFSPINPALTNLGQAIQRCMIEVGEEGTKAAAATVMIGPGAMGPGATAPVTLHFNRPFAFAIVQKQTHDFMFMGVIKNP